MMRLDKYLKTARILKRRTVSKELADQERVYVNGKIAKPSTDVKVGDTIKVEEKLIKKEEVKDILAEE